MFTPAGYIWIQGDHYASSPMRTKSSWNRPDSNCWKMSPSTKAKQSDDALPMTIEAFNIRPQTSDIAWRLTPNLPFWPHRNFFSPTPDKSGSYYNGGFCIQISTSSIQPAQLEKPTSLLSLKPFAIFFSSQRDFGYSMLVQKWPIWWIQLVYIGKCKMT